MNLLDQLIKKRFYSQHNTTAITTYNDIYNNSNNNVKNMK